MSRNWYAVYTKPQCEKKVAALLTKKKIENLCPLNCITNSPGYRRKLFHEPLFPTFVFVYITEAEIHEVRKTSDVINFVYWLGKPAVIKHAEVENVAYFTSVYHNIKLEKTSVVSGGMIRITKEPVQDADPEKRSLKTTKIRLTLPSLGFVITANTEKTGTDTILYETEHSRIGMQHGK